MSILYENVNKHPEFAEQLREMYWNEWSESIKIEYNITDYSEYYLDPTIEYYIGYNSENALVSSIALAANDLNERSNLTPWMSYVYVLPQYRNKEIANDMITWFLNHVKHRPWYLWCKHSLQNFYSKFGFKTIETLNDITIMAH